ncbi:MAG: FAD-binding domain-containing protein [Myxococcota bacterium]
MQVVWLKRDLRVHDHAPLAEAALRAGEGGAPVVVLYVHEPSYWAATEHDAAQFAFIQECLAELDVALRERGAFLTQRVGEMPDVLDALHRAVRITHLYSHMETGNGLTYARDLRVAEWCRTHNVPWTERLQNGVVRRLRDRDGWSTRWNHRMQRPLVRAPERVLAAPVDPGSSPSSWDLGLSASTRPERQRGGEARGITLLDSFLSRRALGYETHLSSPNDAWDGCSRLSPYLAFGALSLRRVTHLTDRRRRRVRDAAWRASLDAFRSRLQWRCHFMQKLESSPRIEHESMNQALDTLWDRDAKKHLDAWQEGQTGYPMVDAAMRCLAATGWINFRMRAMLVSFATHLLWLHWRHPAIHLAQCFVDYEPGIHFPQVQMQAGATGINALRIYDPTKQARDQDPEGTFIRRWVPELEAVPRAYLATPSTLPKEMQRSLGAVVGQHYPVPIVDARAAARHARQRLEDARREPEVRRRGARVLRRHGSRRRRF